MLSRVQGVERRRACRTVRCGEAKCDSAGLVLGWCRDWGRAELGGLLVRLLVRWRRTAAAAALARRAARP